MDDDREINPIEYMLAFICPPLADYVGEKMHEKKRLCEIDYELKKLELEKLRKEIES